MTLQESLLADLIKLSMQGRDKINYLNSRRGDNSWENEQLPSQVLEEFIVKLEKLIAKQPIPVNITPTRQIKAFIGCTDGLNVMPMSRI